jgi:hypothetical protein
MPNYLIDDRGKATNLGAWFYSAGMCCEPDPLPKQPCCAKELPVYDLDVPWICLTEESQLAYCKTHSPNTGRRYGTEEAAAAAAAAGGAPVSGGKKAQVGQESAPAASASKAAPAAKATLAAKPAKAAVEQQYGYPQAPAAAPAAQQDYKPPGAGKSGAAAAEVKPSTPSEAHQAGQDEHLQPKDKVTPVRPPADEDKSDGGDDRDGEKSD